LAVSLGQLGLLWVQGRLLDRQHRDLVALCEEVQILSEILDEAFVPSEGTEGMAPLRGVSGQAQGLQRVRQDPDPAAQELEASRRSARSAVEQAREAQQKLSIEANARKAEAAAQVRRAERKGRTWLWVALSVGLIAFVVRAWLRGRGEA